MSEEYEYMEFVEGKNKLTFMISEFGEVLILANLEDDVCLFNTGLDVDEFCERLHKETDNL